MHLSYRRWDSRSREIVSGGFRWTELFIAFRRKIACSLNEKYTMRNSVLALFALALLVFAATAAKEQPAAKKVVTNSADLALAKYWDKLTTAKALRAAVVALIAKPTQTNLEAARKAWLAACVVH